VQATVRKHSQQGDDDTEYAIAEGGQLFVSCGSGGTSFDVVGCEVLKGEVKKVIRDSSNYRTQPNVFHRSLASSHRMGLNSVLLHLGHRPTVSKWHGLSRSFPPFTTTLRTKPIPRVVRYVDCAPNHLLHLADSYFHSGSLERIAHLALRDRFAGHHSARRTSSAHVGGYRHLPLGGNRFYGDWP
jgi:hypothetical protein